MKAVHRTGLDYTHFYGSIYGSISPKLKKKLPAPRDMYHVLRPELICASA